MARLRAGVRDERATASLSLPSGSFWLRRRWPGGYLPHIDAARSAPGRGRRRDPLRRPLRGDDERGHRQRSAMRPCWRTSSSRNGQQVTFSEFKLDGVKITGTVKITRPASALTFWTKADLQADSVVVRNSNNVEVAIVLDTTGATRHEHGATAKRGHRTGEPRRRTPRRRSIPRRLSFLYSVGVNMGTYADTARGAVRPRSSAITTISKDPDGHHLGQPSARSPTVSGFTFRAWAA